MPVSNAHSRASNTAGLRPWQPGQSGNPGGRPALPEDFRAKGPDALAKLVSLMDHKSPQIALRAAELVIDRIFGKATQPTEHTAGADLLDVLAEKIQQRRNGHSDTTPATD